MAEPIKNAGHKANAMVSDRAVAWSLIVMLLAGALSIPIGQTILSEGEKAAAVSSIVEKPAGTGVAREIRYSIEAANARNSAATAFQPTLQGGFADSGKFRLIFQSDSVGNAYVFGETDDDQGRTGYEVLYPLPRINGGTAHIEPNQQAKTRPGSFSGKSDPQVVWLIWTAGKLDDLETARSSAMQENGVVQGENDVLKLKHFLERNKNNRLTISENEADRQTIVIGSGDRIVHRIEIPRR